MTQYRTLNPLGSMQPRDMFDNAQNIDNWSNGPEPFYEDRFGVMRRSFSGMNFEFEAAQTGRQAAFDQSQLDKESRFQAFLVSSGYVSKGDYAANVVLEERNEYVAVDAATTGTSPGLYRPNASATLPLTLTGTWATDSTNLVLLGDDVLRQELAGAGGAALVGFDGGSLADIFSRDPGKGAAFIGRAAVVIGSVEELRSLSKDSPSRNAFVSGYYAGGDGGGGPYYLDNTDTTSPDNGGTVIVAADGGRWKLQITKAPSVKQFGVRATPDEDQTARLNSVIALFPGKQLNMPAGIYRIDGSVEVSAGTRLTMEKGAILHRMASKTSSTVPVLYVIDSFSECCGGFVKTENDAPQGIVVLGHKSKTDDRNAWYWRFCNMDIEGNGNGWGWVVPSGQVTYPLNANYFGTIDKINTKGVDFGCLLFENANAHNISNTHFWLCRVANIWLRGAYANNFTNMFFHGGSADGCIGIHLVNKAEGEFTESEQNKFVGFTAETGNLNDKAFVIEDLCTGNVLIGTSNVAGGYTIGNYDNNIQLSGYGSASIVSLPGQSAITSGLLPGGDRPITPDGLMSINQSGGYSVDVLVYNDANPNLSRVDRLLIAARNSTFAPSPMAVVGSAFQATGTAGEPTAAAYTLTFPANGSPRLNVNITSQGGVGTFSAKVRLNRI